MVFTTQFWPIVFSRVRVATTKKQEWNINGPSSFSQSKKNHQPASFKQNFGCRAQIALRKWSPAFTLWTRQNYQVGLLGVTSTTFATYWRTLLGWLQPEAPPAAESFLTPQPEVRPFSKGPQGSRPFTVRLRVMSPNSPRTMLVPTIDIIKWHYTYIYIYTHIPYTPHSSNSGEPSYR